MRTTSRPPHAAAIVGSLLIASLFASSALAGTWAWFAEPFTVRVQTAHPEAGPVEGVIVVDAQAVRTEWSLGGMLQVMIARPEGAMVRMWASTPDGSFVAFELTGSDAYELLVHGYVAAVTAPEDPRHPCSASPATHRCTFQAEEQVDGRSLERWRIESTARDGAAVGQLFWYDRDAGLVVRALDDAGADLVFSDHVRGPVDPAQFDVP